MKKFKVILTILLVCAVASLMVYGIMSASTPSPALPESSAAFESSSADSSEASFAEESNKPEQSKPEESIPPEESKDPDKEEKRISFLACPDNIIHPSVYYDAICKAAKKEGKKPVFTDLPNQKYDFADQYEFVADMIKKADLSYVNVETLIGGNENPIMGYPQFNTPEQAGEQLIDLGFDIYNLAHNHMLDSGNDKYLKNCNRFFEERGKTTLGYYKDKADLNNIKIIEIQGIKIAFLAYTYSTNGISLQPGAQTVIPYINEKLIRDQMKIAKENADLVFVSAHWGNEDSHVPNAQQKNTAQLLADLGTDVIIGMHTHTIQEMKWLDRKDGGKCLLTYSLGNFISGMQDGFNMLGGMLSFDIVQKNGAKPTIENPIFHPIVTHYIKTPAAAQYDTGHREYKIYPLEMYTEELAAKHGVQIWDKTHRPTLEGGKFTVENLIKTVKKYIPDEFLEKAFR